VVYCPPQVTDPVKSKKKRVRLSGIKARMVSSVKFNLKQLERSDHGATIFQYVRSPEVIRAFQMGDAPECEMTPISNHIGGHGHSHNIDSVHAQDSNLRQAHGGGLSDVVVAAAEMLGVGHVEGHHGDEHQHMHVSHHQSHHDQQDNVGVNALDMDVLVGHDHHDHGHHHFQHHGDNEEQGEDGRVVDDGEEVRFV
jgi:hypothetical protein